MSGLSKVAISIAALSGRIVLARFGKTQNGNPLETRDATGEFFAALVAYAFGGKLPDVGEAVEIRFGGGDEQFVATIKREAAAPTAR